jgi:hypothetical protein
VIDVLDALTTDRPYRTSRNVQGMMDHGEELDAVCESRHIQFWYPNQVIPDIPVF